MRGIVFIFEAEGCADGVDKYDSKPHTVFVAKLDPQRFQAADRLLDHGGIEEVFAYCTPGDWKRRSDIHGMLGSVETPLNSARAFCGQDDAADALLDPPAKEVCIACKTGRDMDFDEGFSSAALAAEEAYSFCWNQSFDQHSRRISGALPVEDKSNRRDVPVAQWDAYGLAEIQKRIQVGLIGRPIHSRPPFEDSG
nr:hypothetical protein [Methylocapsa palsarum]